MTIYYNRTMLLTGPLTEKDLEFITEVKRSSESSSKG